MILNSSFRFSNLTCDGEVEPTKRWDFQVFYNVVHISFVSQVDYHSRIWEALLQIAEAGLECPSGHELSVEKLVRTDGSCMWTYGNLQPELHLSVVMNLICVYCWFCTCFLWIWAVWIGISTARLVEPRRTLGVSEKWTSKSKPDYEI